MNTEPAFPKEHLVLTK